MRPRSARVLGVLVVRTAALAAAVLGGAAPLAAGLNHWTPLGPEGGAVHAFAAAPGVVYVATGFGGVFRSDDDGEHWQRASQGLPPAGVASLAVLPGDASRPPAVFASVVDVPQGNYLAGLFRSTDGGQSWMPNRELPEGASFARAPSEPRVLYAFGFRSSYGSVYRTRDGGDSWQKLSFPADNAGALAVDPWNAATLYAAVGEGVVGSTDGGASWAPAGGNAVFAGTPVAALLFDPAAPRTLLAVAGDGRVLASRDGAATWKLLSRLPTGESPVSFAASAGGTLYVSDVLHVFTSADHGLTWSPAAAFDDSGPRGAGRAADAVFPIASLAADPSSPRGLYAATDHGVFHSRDGGGSWSLANRGLVATVVEDVALDPSNPAILYVSVSGRGLLKSVNGGVSWRLVNAGLNLSIPPTSLAIDPQRANVLYAAGGGIARSLDAAATWQYLPLGQGCGTSQVAVAPSSPRTVYSWGCVADPSVCPGSGGCSFNRSVDRGGTWACGCFPESNPGGIVIDPADSAIVYAFGDRVSKSLDGGRTWRSAGPSDLPSPGALAVDPSSPQTVYAGGYAQVEKSTDGGRRWRSFRDGLPQPTPDDRSSLQLTSLAIDPQRPATLYACAASPDLFLGIGIFRSADGGATWSHLSRGLPRDALSGPLVVDPRTGTVYAGTTGFGLYTLTPTEP